jgi:hypothetical protein
MKTSKAKSNQPAMKPVIRPIPHPANPPRHPLKPKPTITQMKSTNNVINIACE